MNFESFNLTNKKEKKDKLPELIQVGTFVRSVNVPALLPFSMSNGLFLEISSNEKEEADRQLECIVLNLLKQVNTDMLNIKIVDIGISTSFPYLHRLKMPNLKFISEKKELEIELENIYRSARTINTQFLTSTINTLEKFNDTTEYKEPYNILIVPDFPKKFNFEEVEKLISIIKEASNCGFYTFATFDKSYLPEKTKFNIDKIQRILEIKECMINLDCTQNPVSLNNLNIPILKKQFQQYNFKFERYSDFELNSVIDEINSNINSKYENETNFISIPIGRAGRNELNFELGAKADAYHCMIAGQSGTGKSTLLNLLITRIAEFYTPEEIRLFLLDYKEGVEFGIYKNHPNVDTLLLDNSNIEFAIELLEEFEKEFQKRGQLFNNLGTTIRDIDKYNAKSKTKLPRIILIIDEVHELFTKGYEFSRRINQVLNRVAKQGRSFGIHLIFCSQSFADCRIDDGVLKQTKLRIAFRLSDGSDCRAILGRENEAPMRLQKYQIVYNSDNGFYENNIIANTYNFDENEIENILEKKSADYEKFFTFKKKIIEKGKFSAHNNPDFNETLKDNSRVTFVKRDLKIKPNLDEYGF